MATKKYISLDKLSLYDEKIKKVITDGDAASLASAKEYADGLADNYEPAGSIATAKSELQGNINAVEAKADAAQEAADKAQGEVDALETFVGTLPEGTAATSVVDYVNVKTAGIATDAALGELNNQVSGLQTVVNGITADYLKEEDKTELSDAIGAEKSRAEGVESGLRTDVDAIKGDYLKAADKTELQGNIDTVSGGLAAVKEDVDAFFKDADMTASAKDTLKELQAYIVSDETAASEMLASIQQNARDIDAVEGRLDTAEGKITTAEGKITTLEGNITTLQGEDTAIKGRLDALEGVIGESGSVADDIATAKQEAIDAAAGDATTKANTAESNAKGHADSLNTAMNTRVEALEAIDHEHSNKTELDLIATGDKAKWDTAAGKAHEHSNKTILDGITSAKVTAWDAAEGNAKTHANGLNTAMDTRMTAVETWQTNFVECSEEDITGLFTA